MLYFKEKYQIVDEILDFKFNNLSYVVKP